MRLRVRKGLVILRWIGIMLVQGIPFGILSLFILLIIALGSLNSMDWDYGELFKWSVYLLALTSWVAYVFIYPIRHLIRKLHYGDNKFLRALSFLPWLYLDDKEENDYGPKWFIDSSNLQLDTPLQRFWASWKWSAERNPTWNLQGVLKPKHQSEHELKIISATGRVERGGMELDVMSLCGFKYVDETGKYSDNKGDYLSYEYSKLGKMMVWYELDGTLFWRFSFAGLKNNRWIEIHLGTNEYRYTWRIKVYKDLVFYEDIFTL